MGKFSKDKGRRGEREAVKLLKTLGFEARRSSQYQGFVNEALSADVIHNIEGLRIEVKNGYNAAPLYGSVVREWIDTAILETPQDDQWIILWKKDRQPWLVITQQDGLTFITYDVDGFFSRIKRKPE